MFPGFRYFQTKQCKSVNSFTVDEQLNTPRSTKQLMNELPLKLVPLSFEILQILKISNKTNGAEFHHRITRVAPSNLPSPKTTWTLSLKHRRKVGLHHCFRRRELNFKCMKWTVDCLHDCTLEWFHRMTSFCIFNEICKGISSSDIFNNPAGAIHQTLTIVRFLNGSNCDLRHLRVIPKNVKPALSARASPF